MAAAKAKRGLSNNVVPRWFRRAKADLREYLNRERAKEGHPDDSSYVPTILLFMPNIYRDVLLSMESAPESFSDAAWAEYYASRNNVSVHTAKRKRNIAYEALIIHGMKGCINLHPSLGNEGVELAAYIDYQKMGVPVYWDADHEVCQMVKDDSEMLKTVDISKRIDNTIADAIIEQSGFFRAIDHLPDGHYVIGLSTLLKRLGLPGNGATKAIRTLEDSGVVRRIDVAGVTSTTRHVYEVVPNDGIMARLVERGYVTTPEPEVEVDAADASIAASDSGLPETFVETIVTTEPHTDSIPIPVESVTRFLSLTPTDIVKAVEDFDNSRTERLSSILAKQDSIRLILNNAQALSGLSGVLVDTDLLRQELAQLEREGEELSTCDVLSDLKAVLTNIDAFVRILNILTKYS
jgi:ribosomal protein S25